MVHNTWMHIITIHFNFKLLLLQLRSKNYFTFGMYHTQYRLNQEQLCGSLVEYQRTYVVATYVRLPHTRCLLWWLFDVFVCIVCTLYGYCQNKILLTKQKLKQINPCAQTQICIWTVFIHRIYTSRLVSNICCTCVSVYF